MSSFLSSEYVKLLRSFKRNGVDFLLIGGHAAIYHGVRRTTSDIDILVRPSKENGEKVLKALKDINLTIEDITPEEFEKEMYLSYGSEPEAVDILNFTPGIVFEDVFKNAVVMKRSGIDVRIIDIRDLIKNKEALNRTGVKALTDQQDLLVLKQIISKK